MVSIIVPNYNHTAFLEARIRSLLSQDFVDYEILLLDDASSDNSVDILRGYESHPKVRVQCSNTNSGSPFRQWRRGIDMARGEFVWIAESDDTADSAFLKTLMSRLESDTSVSVAYCQSRRIDCHGRDAGGMGHWTNDLDATRWLGDYTNEGVAECRDYLVHKNTIPNASAVVFRKSAFVAVDEAFEQLKLCGDWLAWSQILLAGGRLSYVSQPLNCFREHSRSVRSVTSPDVLRRESAVVRNRIVRGLRAIGESAS